MKRIIDGAWLIPLGFANSVLLQGEDDQLVLIDAGFPDKETAVFDALTSLGRRPEDLAHIVFTHAHPDHIGSGAAIVKRTGAKTWMHATDAPVSETGGPFRPMSPAPGPVQRLGYRLFWRPDDPIAPVHIDEQFTDDQTLPLAGGLEVIPTPGHSAGQVALHWKRGDMMLLGDVGSNMLGISDPLGFEDRAAGRRSQQQIASRAFTAASFGHGKAIPNGAASRIQKAWGGR